MAMSSPSNPLNPTFEGHITSTLDALILFEACLSGQLKHVPRRPHDRERQGMIKSGNVSSVRLTASRRKGSERALIGTLVDSYTFKNNGLVKKTISVSFQGVPHHLVSYYNVNDVMSGRLTTPTKHPNLRNVIRRAELMLSQKFCAPIDDECNPYERMGHAMFAGPPGHDYGHTRQSFQCAGLRGRPSSSALRASIHPTQGALINDDVTGAQHGASMAPRFPRV
ncbi:uncharacterized protein FTOL_13237 [Fusarium torulosum]|uniref:Uncharacterized protein n=1 Tax=Fusarium torulosum TaxID=33205 RepID=A0AAE8MLC3_9HYPO|nr:uncharacterized protein FTOL_13237 [Fusarium torulosum]